MFSAHQEGAHLVQQIESQLRGKPLVPYTYRDFGSLVSLSNSAPLESHGHYLAADG